MPCKFVGALTLGDLVEVFHHEDETIILVVEIVLLALSGLELSLEKTFQGLGFLYPLKDSEHWPHWNNFKSANFQLFFVGFRILQEASVDQLEQFLYSLIQSDILASLHQQHVCFLVGTEDGYSLWSSDGLQGKDGAVEGLNVDLVPGQRLLEFVVEDARDFQFHPVTHVVLFEPETAVG